MTYDFSSVIEVNFEYNFFIVSTNGLSFLMVEVTIVLFFVAIYDDSNYLINLTK